MWPRKRKGMRTNVNQVRLGITDLAEIDRIMAGSVPMAGPHPEMMPE